MAIKLRDEQKARAIESIKRFFAERMEDDLGDLKASYVLEFFLKEIGPTVYNQAIVDAQTFMQDRVTDLDSSCYEPERGYWKK